MSKDEEDVTAPLRAYLVEQIVAKIKAADLSQAEAARRLGVPQPRMNRLVKHKDIHVYGVDTLLLLADRVGLDFSMTVKERKKGAGAEFWKPVPPKDE